MNKHDFAEQTTKDYRYSCHVYIIKLMVLFCGLLYLTVDYIGLRCCLWYSIKRFKNIKSEIIDLIFINVNIKS